jgi:diacylglycerol kinase family enzyme
VTVFVVLNAGAGGATSSEDDDRAAQRVRDAFGKAGIAAEIACVRPGKLQDEIRKSLRGTLDAVVVGGGDGTLNAAAQCLVGATLPLGILPMGTLNHFAKDVGLPLGLDDAVSVIAAGHVRQVDVGEVNGRYFLNNSSIGLYPAAVSEREELRHRHGGGKWVAMAQAAFDLLRRYPLLTAEVTIDGKAMHLRTPFIFVGNNQYEMNFFSLGRRKSLEAGELSVYLSRDGGRAGLVRQALRGILGRLEQDRDFRSYAARQLAIATGRRRVRVSADGEIQWMTPPVRYAVHPGALKVIAPQAAPA